MWKCRKCSEKLEDNFDNCWKCGYSRNGSPPVASAVGSNDAFLPNGELQPRLDNSETSTSSGSRPANTEGLKGQQRGKPRAKSGKSRNSEEHQGFRIQPGETKCSECGSHINAKAEICPKCGVRLKPVPTAKTGSGCIVGMFKIVGGLIGSVIAIGITVKVLSNQTSVPPVRQIEIRCEEGSKVVPPGVERKAFYDNCIEGAMSAIRAQERINREGGQLK